MGLMPKEESGAFEERLVADKEFFERLAPALSIWMTSRPVPPRIRRRLDAWDRRRWNVKWYQHLFSMKWVRRHWFG